VKVLFFAIYRDLAGADDLELELPEGASVGQLIETVVDRLGADLSPGNLAVAVNQEYVHAGTVLHDGDEVAFIPPVAGG
jgi:molybdopterin converting factor subunit 1